MEPSLLRVSDAVFEGVSPSYQTGIYPGEVVFTTGMTGYIETLTDPSYAGQIVVFTYPLIGNYGVPPKELWESEKIWAEGVVIADLCHNPSHYQSEQTLLAWLKEQGVPVIANVDTRALTKFLREKGTTAGEIVSSIQEPRREHPQYNALVKTVSTPEIKKHGSGKKRVIALDCGMKHNILRELVKRGVEVIQCPYDYDFTNEPYDGLFLSNGPGDPTDCMISVKLVQKAMKQEKPIFGICLGTQLMALAAGAKTYKLKFGHRGHNQPCLDVERDHAYLTSQNHGYAIDEKTLPKGWVINFKNLNDGSTEGIKHVEKPFFSVQFHPEAYPGPHDTRYLFDQFIEKL